MLEDTILPCAINAELTGRVLHPLTEHAHFAVVRVSGFTAIAFAAFVNDEEEAQVGNMDSAFASGASGASASAHITAATSPAVATPRSRPVISVAILLAAAARRTPSPIALAAAVGLTTVTVAAVPAVAAVTTLRGLIPTFSRALGLSTAVAFLSASGPSARFSGALLIATVPLATAVTISTALTFGAAVTISAALAFGAAVTMVSTG
mmetsp:Transcript_51000/g.103762  ORF Transcript_51000/g.103762 Transcript_51000/m.103762 type:complete len:208 (+) Transcript_51000:152-775(+)